MADLLPCPFCGSTNLRYEFAGSQGYIECNECGTEGPCDERAADPYCDDDAACDAWNRRAAALADEPAVPQPQPPAEGEVAGLVRLLGSMAAEAELADQVHDASVLDRAADLLQRLSPPQPVPVSERLPGPEDCDAEGRCWLFSKVEKEWRLIDAGNPGVPHLKYCFSHWLPAHALPVPHQQENAND